MGISSRMRRSPAILVGLIALTAALAGSGIAQSGVTRPVTKSQVKQIARKQVEKLSPGLSVAKAASADAAANADRLDNLDSAQFLRSDGCQPGVLPGSARFNPAQMTASPGYSTAGVTAAKNCAGGTVEAQRIGTGDFRIRFNGLAASTVVCGGVDDGDSPPLIISLTASLIGPGHWRVRSGDLVNNVVTDNKFACVVA